MNERFALIIGIENYQDHRISPVRHAENDARDFAGVLQLHGYDAKNIRLLPSSTATKTTIESHLRTTLSSADEDDYVTIFYAGHGFAENDHNYLTCSDTVRGDLVQTSISLQAILKGIRKSKCKKIVLFLDSCHSGFEIDESMRGILSDITDDEFREFFKDSEYHIAFASCDTAEYSYSSNKLRHGIWTHHIIEAFKGNAVRALERNRFLTADSLQVYLSKEVPRTVRKLVTGPQVQRPRVLGNCSKEFILADFKEIFEQKAAKLQPNLAQLKKVFFSGSRNGRVRALSGFRKYHEVPDSVNSAAERFVTNVGHQEVEDYANKVFQDLKQAFRFKRRDIDLTTGDSSASIQTNDFTVNIWLAINPDDPSEYLLTTEVTDIRNPVSVRTKAFNSVFERTFNSLTFQFDKKFDIEALIDAVEAIHEEDLISVEYPADASSCTIYIKGLEAKIMVTPHEFVIEHTYSMEPIKLIDSFSNAQKLLINEHNIKMLPLHS